jgi:hypothetical protein
MKKIVLIAGIVLTSLCASAQYMAVSNINKPTDDESWGFSNFTDNIGVGYQLNDDFVLGVQQSGDDWGLFGRYNISENLYLSAQTAEGVSTDSMSVGVGYSVKFWNSFYVEPNYIWGVSKEGEGEFKIGIAYRF